MAGLHKYFQRVTLLTSDETGLGEAVTKEVNHAVERILNEQNEVPTRKRKYTHFSPENRAKIAKYASQCGKAVAARHFRKDFPNLGESTVRLFKKQYLAEIINYNITLLLITCTFISLAYFL